MAKRVATAIATHRSKVDGFGPSKQKQVLVEVAALAFCGYSVCLTIQRVLGVSQLLDRDSADALRFLDDRLNCSFAIIFLDRVHK